LLRVRRMDLLLVPIANRLADHAFFRSTATILRHSHGGWEVVFMGFRVGLGVARALAWVAMFMLLHRELGRELGGAIRFTVCGPVRNAALDFALIAASPSLREACPW